MPNVNAIINWKYLNRQNFAYKDIPRPIKLIEIIYYNFDRNNVGNIFDEKHRYASSAKLNYIAFRETVTSVSADSGIAMPN